MEPTIHGKADHNGWFYKEENESCKQAENSYTTNVKLIIKQSSYSRRTVMSQRWGRLGRHRSSRHCRLDLWWFWCQVGITNSALLLGKSADICKLWMFIPPKNRENNSAAKKSRKKPTKSQPDINDAMNWTIANGSLWPVPSENPSVTGTEEPSWITHACFLSIDSLQSSEEYTEEHLSIIDTHFTHAHISIILNNWFVIAIRLGLYQISKV